MDAIKILGVFIIGLALPSALFGNWWWFWIWNSIAVLIALWELYGRYISLDKKTISKQFWKWKEEHPKVKFVALGGYILFFGYLAMHLWFGW